MSNKKQRESNIELLRIISMLIIVIYHFLIHSIIPNSPELNYITKPLITVLHIGVICFVLISGYWGIKFSLKSFTKIFFYCSFYSILIYLFGVLLNPELFSIKNSIKSLFPIQWWFIPVYLCLFLLTPIINTQLKTANKSTKIFTIILLIIISFGFGQFVPSLSGGKNPINFILIYYLGNYLRTELNTYKLNIKKIIFLYLGCNIILFTIIFLAEIFFPDANKIIHRLFFPYNKYWTNYKFNPIFSYFHKVKILV
jgi:surface polysaccharide O-acyltransferase-like enzyme